jgi:hypothetical protein
VDRLRDAAAAGNAWFAPIEDKAARAAVAALVAEGDRRQFADPSFRRELASWIRSRRSDDGLSRPLPPLTHVVLRTFDVGGRAAAHDLELAAGSPLLAVIGTEGDDAQAWLCAGQALALVLLSARERGVWASFLNQPVEVSELRPRLRDVVGRGGFPQLLLRLGYGPRVDPAPRRPVEAVLVP